MDKKSLTLIFVLLSIALSINVLAADSYFCYQESTNTSNQSGKDGSCGLTYNGNNDNSSAQDCGNLAWDGNWATGCYRASCGLHNIIFNYTKPSYTVLGATWDVSAQDYENLTVFLDCLNSTVVSLKFNESNAGSNQFFYCYNYSNESYVQIGTRFGCSSFQEEGIRWNISTVPTGNLVNFTDTTTQSGIYSQDWIFFNVTNLISPYPYTNITLWNNNSIVYTVLGLATYPVFHNITGLADGTYILNATNTTQTYQIILDNVNPMISTNIQNNRFFYLNDMKNFSGQINFSDDNLYGYNISIDNQTIFNEINISFDFYPFNLSYNISNLSKGIHTLVVTSIDGHTANSIADMEVSDGLLFKNSLTFKTKEKNQITIKKQDTSMLDSFTYAKQYDRYIFNFTPSSAEATYSFIVTTKEKGYIIDRPESKWKKWIVTANNWVDFYSETLDNDKIEIIPLNKENTEFKVFVYRKKDAPLIEKGFTGIGETINFESIGVLNMLTQNYSFYIFNASETHQSTVFEGASTPLTLTLTMPNITSFIEIVDLIYNNVSVGSGTKTVIDNDTIEYSKIVLVSYVNSSQINWTWNFNFSEDSLFQTFNISGSSTFTAMNITNCTTPNYVVFNWTAYDEDNKTTLDATKTTIETDTTFFVPSDPTTYFNFSVKTQNNTLLLCLPTGILNTTNFIVDSITKFYSDGYSVEYYYIENFTLTKDVIPKSLKLYDLISSKSTSFLITYQDENYLYKENILIDLQRKYISEGGLFTSVEHAKTDPVGQTRLHLITEDVIYKFNIWDNGQLIYTTPEYLALCQATPCQINIRKSYTSNSSLSQTSNIYYSITDDEEFGTSKTITFDFATKDMTSSEINLTVIRNSNGLNQSICTNYTNSASGSLTCQIPLSYRNTTYTAKVYKDGKFLGIKMYSDKPTAQTVFGHTGIVITIICFLLLSFMSMSSPTISLLLGLLGLIGMTLVNFIDGGSFFGIGSAFIWLIIALIIIVYKLSQRRNQ